MILVKWLGCVPKNVNSNRKFIFTSPMGHRTQRKCFNFRVTTKMYMFKINRYAE